jgi:putative oxidoreductase
MKAAVNYPDEAPPATPSRSFARYLPAIVRILLGLLLLVFGLNGFLNFIPPPKAPLPEGAAAFATALMKSGYMMQLIALTQLVVGVLLLANRFVPLALLLLAPFLVNSLCFHIFLEHSGLPMSCVFAALELYLVWVYRRAYAPLFVARAGRA